METLAVVVPAPLAVTRKEASPEGEGEIIRYRRNVVAIVGGQYQAYAVLFYFIGNGLVSNRP